MDEKEILKINENKMNSMNLEFLYNLGSLIFPGQALRIPQFNGSKIVSEGGGDLEHVVRQGETACGIANQYGIKCEQLILFNKLGNEDVILPEQKLVIPGVWAEKYQHPLGLSPLDQTFDFSVQVADINGKKIFRINAEATETLEHYADWLMITDLDMIRQLNHDMSSESLYIGDVLLLPITSEKQLDTFQRERQD